MIYNFVDTIEASGNAVLPSEALKLNGEYIENLIPGYRTLHVAGREALSPELDYVETGIKDGAKRKYKRYPARYITVTYQLLAESNKAFRDAFNALGSILDVEDAEMIFADEPDKYFTGTPSEFGEIEPGKNAVIGEIVFFCEDPFKYSVKEYEVEAATDDGLYFAVDYNGTYNSYPELQAEFYNEEEADGETKNTLTGSGDCGYVAFFNEYEKIVQLGNPDEAEGEALEEAQTLVNQTFSKSTSWGTAVQNLFPLNSGIVTSDSVVQTGTFKIGKSHSDAGENDYYLTPNSYGSGAKWHGPSITRIIPVDATGNVGATNFNYSWRQKMAIGSGTNAQKQRGAFQTLLIDANGKIIAGVNIYKGDSGKKAKLQFYLNGEVKETISIDLSLNNKYFGQITKTNKAVRTSSIVKSGQSVTFNIGGIQRTYRDSAIAESVVAKFTMTLTKKENYTPLSYNGVFWVKFVKNNCETWRDVPNKFSANDIVVADCMEGKIYLNDAESPQLGALGNDWEEFYLRPGLNQIGVAYSDWVEDNYAPTFKIRYREVFL